MVQILFEKGVEGSRLVALAGFGEHKGCSSTCLGLACSNVFCMWLPSATQVLKTFGNMSVDLPCNGYERP